MPPMGLGESKNKCTINAIKSDDKETSQEDTLPVTTEIDDTSTSKYYGNQDQLKENRCDEEKTMKNILKEDKFIGNHDASNNYISINDNSTKINMELMPCITVEHGSCDDNIKCNELINRTTENVTDDNIDLVELIYRNNDEISFCDDNNIASIINDEISESINHENRKSFNYLPTTEIDKNVNINNEAENRDIIIIKEQDNLSIIDDNLKITINDLHKINNMRNINDHVVRASQIEQDYKELNIESINIIDSLEGDIKICNENEYALTEIVDEQIHLHIQDSTIDSEIKIKSENRLEDLLEKNNLNIKTETQFKVENQDDKLLDNMVDIKNHEDNIDMVNSANNQNELLVIEIKINEDNSENEKSFDDSRNNIIEEFPNQSIAAKISLLKSENDISNEINDSNIEVDIFKNISGGDILYSSKDLNVIYKVNDSAQEDKNIASESVDSKLSINVDDVLIEKLEEIYDHMGNQIKENEYDSRKISIEYDLKNEKNIYDSNILRNMEDQFIKASYSYGNVPSSLEKNSSNISDNNSLIKKNCQDCDILSQNNEEIAITNIIENIIDVIIDEINYKDSKIQDLRSSIIQDPEASKNQSSVLTEVQEHGSSEIQDTKYSKTQDSGSSEIQGIRSLELFNLNPLEIQDSESLETQEPNFFETQNQGASETQK